MPAIRLAKINLKRSPVSFGALHTVSVYCVKGHRRDGAVMMLFPFHRVVVASRQLFHVLFTESQNYLGCKRPLRSPSSACGRSPPCKAQSLQQGLPEVLRATQTEALWPGAGNGRAQHSSLPWAGTQLLQLCLLPSQRHMLLINGHIA